MISFLCFCTNILKIFIVVAIFESTPRQIIHISTVFDTQPLLNIKFLSEIFSHIILSKPQLLYKNFLAYVDLNLRHESESLNYTKDFCDRYDKQSFAYRLKIEEPGPCLLSTMNNIQRPGHLVVGS